MEIEKIVVGPLQENCYLIKQNNKIIIIDPGDEFNKIKERIKDGEVKAILITHHHFDHIGALKEVQEEYHIEEINPKTVEGFHYVIIETPGHKEDCITIYFPQEKCMFCGDFIFYHNIGRCDLPGGNIEKMKESLKKIIEYPQDTILYPGHGPKTKLKEEIPILIEFEKTL